MPDINNLNLNDEIETQEITKDNEVSNTETNNTETDNTETDKDEKLKKTREIAEKLPKVTLITSVHNSKKAFPILLRNFYILNYPADKLEWIIVDDGDVSISNMLPVDDERIKYYYIDAGGKILFYERMLKSLKKNSGVKRKKKIKKDKSKTLRDIHKDVFHEKRLPVGMTRNICCQFATGDIIMHYDIDYFYPYDSVYIKASKLVENKDYDMVASTQIGAFYCSKFISLVYNDLESKSLDKRLDDSSLAYRKSFWLERKFDNQDITRESILYVKSRTHKIMLVDGLRTTVLLLHNDIVDKHSKVFEKAKKQEKPNGWHFGKVHDKLFVDITTIDEEIKELEFTK